MWNQGKQLLLYGSRYRRSALLPRFVLAPVLARAQAPKPTALESDQF